MSDQMKTSGNMVKSGERNIPWSQQVDEASYENLSSPTSPDSNPGSHQKSTQFQYPPFNAKEYSNKASNFKSYVNKRNDKQFSYNNSKREEPHQNAWSSPRAQKTITDNFSMNTNCSSTSADSHLGNTRRESNSKKTFHEERNTNVTAFTPKKTTWASVASQPAKQISRVTLLTSNQKRKGPGMPPPPMVPGKHDLEINSWDLPQLNLSQVPSCPSTDSPNNLKPELSFATDTHGDQSVFSSKSTKDHSLSESYALKKDRTFNLNNSSLGSIRSSQNQHTKSGLLNYNVLLHNRQPNVAEGELLHRAHDSCLTNPVISQLDDLKGGRILLNSQRELEKAGWGEKNYCHDEKLQSNSDEIHAILDGLRFKNNYNPLEIDLVSAKSARFFVIKSYSEDDIHRSIKYEIWCSTENGNKRLDSAFKERAKEGGSVMLFFSVNGSGHFCGMAQMMTAVDYNSRASVWSQDKWKGKFKVKWIYVKDVPNSSLRHLHLENNDNKPVTKSRDTQEVPNAQGIEMLRIIHSFEHTTSLFDDFSHYEVRQREETSSKKPNTYEANNSRSIGSRHYSRPNDEDDLHGRNGRNNANINCKYFPSSSGGVTFRDRNNRNHYSIKNDSRSYENPRNNDYNQSPKERQINSDKGNFAFRARQDERAVSHSNNVEQIRGQEDKYFDKNQSRFLHASKEPQKIG